MEKKGAIELSINLIVIVIISLVVLGSGIALLYKLIGGAEDIKSTLDSKTEAELERLLVDQGKKVALPQYTATVYAGKTHLFGVGILNIDEKSYGKSFKLSVKLNKAVDETEKEITKPDTSKWLLYDTGPHEIKENEHQKIAILVSVPNTAKKGTYIFDVTITDSSNNVYDSLKKLMVTVK